jgi:anthranilate synthase component 2
MMLTSMNSPFTAARYHSLVIEKESFPHDALEITAWTEDGLVMAARHKKYKHIQVLLNPVFRSTSCVP